MRKSSGPLCRPCSIFHPELRLRTPNRATHIAVFVDGLATLACRTHTRMALRAGGFALDLKRFPVLYDRDEPPKLSRKLTAAIVATAARARAREAIYDDELTLDALPELPPPG